MTTAQRTAIASPASGLLVYDTNTGSFWFNDGAAWNEISNGNNGWKTSGNTGTNPSVNFIGTTDNQPLYFKINNQQAGLLDSSALGVAFLAMRQAGVIPVSAIRPWAINRLEQIQPGLSSTANGYKSLDSNTTGGFNTALGALSLMSNTTGTGNAATGVSALWRKHNRELQHG